MSQSTSRRRWAYAALWLRFYVSRSVALDRATLRLNRWPAPTRARLLASKTRALPRLQSGRSAQVAVGPVMFTATSVLDLGSMQACLVDVHDDLVASGVLDADGSPVVVDVGANVGQFLVALKAFVPAARVLSVEPDPDSHARLTTNAERLADVTTRCVAVGSEPGTLRLHRHHVSMMSTLRPEAPDEYDPALSVDVEVVRLDDITAHLPVVDLLKIDVEGFEAEALEGARDLLGRTRYLLLELSLGREAATSNLDVLAQVRAAAPDARVLRFGRPLGDPEDPICQDVLLALRGPGTEEY